MSDNDIRDITVIGAGPVGLITAFWAGMREASSRIIDSLPGARRPADHALPGEVDLRRAGLSRASSPRTWSRSSASSRSSSSTCRCTWRPLPTASSTSTTRTIPSGRSCASSPTRASLRSRTLIIAGGHGAFEPKKLPGYDMTPGRARAPTTSSARSPSSRQARRDHRRRRLGLRLGPQPDGHGASESRSSTGARVSARTR